MRTQTVPRRVSVAAWLPAALLLLALWAPDARAQVPNPVYTVTLQDAVTGDNGLQSFVVPGVTCVNCRVPDPNPPAGSVSVDNYTLDVWERPTQSGSSANVYLPALDIVSYEIGFDNDFLYYRMRLFGVDNQGTGKRLPYLYAYESNIDSDPRGDVFVRVTDPSSKGLDDVFGTQGVTVHHDANNNVGGLLPLSPEGPGANVDGYEFLVFDQGNNLVPGDPGGADAVQARTILIGGAPYLELAVKRSFLNAVKGTPVTTASFRPYAAKGGGTTNQNQLYQHDQYGRDTAGSPYPWLQQAGAPVICPNTSAAENALTPAQRAALNSGTNVATAFSNPCYPSGGNLVEFDNAGTVDELAGGTTISFTPPTVAKSFTPPSIGAGGASTLTITLTAVNATTVTGAAFTDTYPANLFNTASPTVTNTCGGTVTAAANSGSLALTGGTIPGSSFCTITVQVTSAVVGSYNNSTGPLTTSNAGTGTAAAATLTVLARPTIVKDLTPATISPGGSSVLTLTLSNSNAVPLTSAAFTDTFPTTPGQMSLFNAVTSNSCGGILDEADAFDVNNTLNAGDRTVRLTGGTIPASGNCVVTVNVTATAAGLYTNTIPANGLTTANGGTNTAAASDTLTVGGGSPSLMVAKMSTAFSDPVNDLVNPKRIPGGFVTYTIIVTNSGSGAVDNNTTVITDPIPVSADLFVGDVGAPGSGPVGFVQGTPTSGLTYTFTALANATDDVLFSSDGGATYTYTPVPDVNGMDPLVTHIRINPKGVFAGDPSPGSPSPNFSISFRIRIE